VAPGASLALGVKIIVNVAASYVREPDISTRVDPLTRPPGLPGLSKVKAAGVIVAGSIASLNVTVTIWLSGTLVARFMGFVEITNGHVPTCPTFSSLQPLIKAAENRAAIAVIKIFFVFIFLRFRDSFLIQ
jgi:hypothetical protein